MTDAAAVDAALAAIETRYGAITILVNNAGITRDNLLLRMKDEEWDDDHGDQPEAGVPALARRCCAA